MTVTDKNLLETYSNLFEGLSFSNKIELIERLTKSIKGTKSKESNFYNVGTGKGYSNKEIVEMVDKNDKVLLHQMAFFLNL